MDNKIIIKVVSNNLKSARLKKGFLQSDVAELLNVERQTIVNWENKPQTLNIDKLLKLAKLYDCDVSYFFGI